MARTVGNEKPVEVSDRVWANAQDWKDQGREIFDRPVPVNQVQFARRLNGAILKDKFAQRILRERGPEWLNEVIDRMIKTFWASLEVGDENTSSLQFKFLSDDWDELLYRAHNSVLVHKIDASLRTGDGGWASKPLIDWDLLEKHRNRDLAHQQEREAARQEFLAGIADIEPDAGLSEEQIEARESRKANVEKMRATLARRQKN